MEVGPDDNLTTTVAPAGNSGGQSSTGFVVSLLGLLACCLLSPIGLILSYAEMRKQPGGLATAGFVMGLIGTLLLLLTVVGIGIALFLMKDAYGPVFEQLEQVTRGQEASHMVDSFAEEHGRLPTPEEAEQMFAQKGPAGKSLVLETGKQGAYAIRDPGADGKHGTSDDYSTYGSVTLRRDE
ncbi:hypothetical protein [Blastopirellula marina]|uniref:DUF4190 domain-containing protein n=1 Tax=Blastopirellula marina TaxID=124 RepID=A0A2S8GEY4_9BACT|nr:hypothetical protein [Blastopirellula marina]PQO43018.1 hypothetical protein C5Y93_25215 [Blastopirellula marina]